MINFPQELRSLILTRLSVKDLANARSACKTFRDDIDNKIVNFNALNHLNNYIDKIIDKVNEENLHALVRYSNGNLYALNKNPAPESEAKINKHKPLSAKIPELLSFLLKVACYYSEDSNYFYENKEGNFITLIKSILIETLKTELNSNRYKNANIEEMKVSIASICFPYIDFPMVMNYARHHKTNQATLDKFLPEFVDILLTVGLHVFATCEFWAEEGKNHLHRGSVEPIRDRINQLIETYRQFDNLISPIKELVQIANKKIQDCGVLSEETKERYQLNISLSNKEETPAATLGMGC